ncbi:MAG: hypothetical protein COC05_00535 [Gammaproteobacteria bacterium]|nr:MAG: hypothetical protein COC05_00535 [Gammaproteobacteria bacterium]
MNELTPQLFSVSILLSVICISNPTYAVDDCELNGKPIDTGNGKTTEGKSGLIRCIDRDSGELRREEELLNGSFEGVVRYFRAGKLQSEFSQTKIGNKHGLYREFESGQLVKEQMYNNGSTEGLSRYWSLDGKLKRVTFSGKERRGEVVAYAEWADNGLLYELQCGPKPVLKPEFDDEKYCGHSGKPGTVELFSYKGMLSTRSVYEVGKLIQRTRFWDDGKTVSREHEITTKNKIEREFSNTGVKLTEKEWVHNNDGVYYRKSELIYYITGILQTERRWIIIDSYESPVSVASFYMNGQSQSREEYTKKDSIFFISSKRYQDNGKLSFEGHYLQEDGQPQRPDGVHSSYNEQGVLVNKKYYDEQGQITREQSMSADGSIISDKEVFADGSSRAYSK